MVIMTLNTGAAHQDNGSVLPLENNHRALISMPFTGAAVMAFNVWLLWVNKNMGGRVSGVVAVHCVQYIIGKEW